VTFLQLWYFYHCGIFATVAFPQHCDKYVTVADLSQTDICRITRISKKTGHVNPQNKNNLSVDSRFVLLTDRIQNAIIKVASK